MKNYMVSKEYYFKTLLCFYLAFMGTSSLCSQNTSSYKIVPKVLIIEDNVERQLFDFTQTDDLGIIEMIAPKDWTEPIVELNYVTRSFVIEGCLGLQFKDTTTIIKKDEGFIIPKNKRVRIFNAGDGQLKVVEILQPAYKEDFVKFFDSF